MANLFDAAIATLKPFGSFYRSKKPILSARMRKAYIEEAKSNPYCISPVLSSDPILVERVTKAIGSDNVRIKQRYSRTLIMPWDGDPSGQEMSVEELLGTIGEEGWPGYDASLNGVKVFKGTGRFGKEVFAVCPTTARTKFELGGVEVYPVKVREEEERKTR
jgi:hypothetical protein